MKTIRHSRTGRTLVPLVQALLVSSGFVYLAEYSGWHLHRKAGEESAGRALSALDVVLAAQSAIVTGDRSTPLRPVAGGGNVGISNAVLRDQPEVRALRVVVEPGGTRVMHAHTDVKFHLFVPMTGAMTLTLEGQSVTVAPWHPYYLSGGTQHGFHNSSASAVDIMEIFVR